MAYVRCGRIKPAVQLYKKALCGWGGAGSHMFRHPTGAVGSHQRGRDSAETVGGLTVGSHQRWREWGECGMTGGWLSHQTLNAAARNETQPR